MFWLPGGLLRLLLLLWLLLRPALRRLALVQLPWLQPFFFLKLVRCYGEAGCGGLARNSRAEACARLEHHRGASSEAPLRDYVMPGAICWLGAERQRPWSCYTCD